MNIKQLEDLIVSSSLKYYTGQQLLMTDDQFDSAINQLRSMDPNHWILTTPNWGAIEDGVKVKHIGKRPVEGLDKCHYPELPKVQGSNSQGLWETSLKLDGLTSILTIHDGNIVAASRNDGSVGKIHTDNMIAILEKTVPEAYRRIKQFRGTLSIRGEVITNPAMIPVLTEQFKAEGKVFSPRNYAAGLINRNEVTDELANLIFVTYFVRVSSTPFTSRRHMLSFLHEGGFMVVPRLLVPAGDIESIKEFYNENKDLYPIDGLVLTASLDYGKGEMDYTEYEGKSFAYKFQSEAKEVMIDRIEWGAGTTGRYTPVAVLTAPIELNGAMVQNVTCHHAQYVQQNKLGKGSVVKIIRSGEVIPYITEVVTGTEADIPSKCTGCDTDLVMSGTYLECPSHDCPYKSETAIHRLFEVAGVPKGFGPKMITDFLAPIEDADIFKVIDLCHNAGWEVFRDSLQVTFGDHAGKLLVKQLENVRSLMKKGLTNEQFWFILNLKGLSWQNAKKLKKFNPIFVITMRDEFLRFKEEAKVPAPVYEAINKSGQKIARYAEVFKLIEDTTPETPKLDLVVAVTGSVCMPRGEWSKELEKLGITMGAVNKKTHYLVSNEDSNSSKSVKARELGMQVVTETEFYEILESKYNIKVPWRK